MTDFRQKLIDWMTDKNITCEPHRLHRHLISHHALLGGDIRMILSYDPIMTTSDAMLEALCVPLPLKPNQRTTLCNHMLDYNLQALSQYDFAASLSVDGEHIALIYKVPATAISASMFQSKISVFFNQAKKLHNQLSALKKTHQTQKHQNQGSELFYL